MNPTLESFLDARFPFPGLAGWGVRLKERPLAHKAYVAWLTTSRIEQIMGRLTLAAEGVRQHSLQPRRVCWKFEHMRLHLAVRRDGAFLALLVQNKGENPGSTQSVLEDFLFLPGSIAEVD